MGKYVNLSDKMAPARKSFEDYDASISDGRAKLNLLSNLGAQRMIDRVKDYQKSSQYKVLLNFIPTWAGGKLKVWLSHPPEEFTPLKIDNNQNLLSILSTKLPSKVVFLICNFVKV